MLCDLPLIIKIIVSLYAYYFSYPKILNFNRKKKKGTIYSGAIIGYLICQDFTIKFLYLIHLIVTISVYGEFFVIGKVMPNIIQLGWVGSVFQSFTIGAKGKHVGQMEI